MTDKDIKCPCGYREYMEDHNCKQTDCDKCCPLKLQDIVNQLQTELEEKNRDDFCEWFEYDYRTMAPKYHDIDNPYWRIPMDMSKLSFCPYCGKKIRMENNNAE